jgi:carbamoyltransferase
MKILGIHDGHNATASLMIDGKLVAVISEERLTYKKNDMGFPVNAVGECLKMAGIAAKDLDLVAFSTINLPLNYMRIKREYAFSIRDWLDEQEYYWKPKLLQNKINKDYFKKLFTNPKFKEKQAYNFSKVPLRLLDPEENKKLLDKIRKETLKRIFNISPEKVIALKHHDCHQYYAYFGSPKMKGRALVVTADGGGDGENGTVCIAENGKIKKMAGNNSSDLARIYRYITLILGMKIGEHEYKVMGLAPYSSQYEIRKTDKAFKNIFHVPDLLIEYKNRPSDLFFHFRDVLADCRFDGVAGGVQEMVEEVGKIWFQKMLRKLKVSQVVFSGGLSMNVKLNKIIGELKEVKNLYIPASGGDESIAIGACYLANTMYSEGEMSTMENNYLGPAPEDKEITEALKQLKNAKIKKGVTNKEIAKLLSQGKVLGRMSGPMEFGARSLGNRSILANPSDFSIVKKINEKIKFRDFWMPFAPSVLESYVKKYLVNPKNLKSDHMTFSMDTTEIGKKALAAAIHPSDFTARPQIVRKEINPEYYDLIKEFAKITGVGALLNTSFNLHGLPVVCTPKQAVHVFQNSDLDGMIIGKYLILRKII